MLVRTARGFQVKSEKGKIMSKPNLSISEAKKRLKQIEFFKRHKGKRIK